MSSLFETPLEETVAFKTMSVEEQTKRETKLPGLLQSSSLTKTVRRKVTIKRKE